jgi:hypothetical protein
MFLHKGNGQYQQVDNCDFFGTYFKDQHKVLAMDFDGIWVSSEEYKSKLLKAKGLNIKPPHTSRDRTLAMGVPFDDYMEVSVRAGLDILEHGTPEPGLDKYWNKITKMPELKIYIITSRYDKMIPPLIRFIQKHKTHVDGVFNVNNEPKKEIIERLSPDVFVEDSLIKLSQVLSNSHNDSGLSNTNLTNCDFVLFRNLGNSQDKEGLTEKIIDLQGGWSKLHEYLQNKFNQK